MNLVLLGSGLGLGIGAWRNLPPVAAASPAAVVACVVAIGVLAFFVGQRRGAGTQLQSVSVDVRQDVDVDVSCAPQQNMTVVLAAAPERLAGGGRAPLAGGRHQLLPGGAVLLEAVERPVGALTAGPEAQAPHVVVGPEGPEIVSQGP